jgi:hypothetical protein
MRLSGWGKRIAPVRRGPPSATMRCRPVAIMLVAQVCLVLLPAGSAFAQSDRIAMKSGESVELGPVYWVANCRSIMVGLPEAEILEGPPGLALSVKEAMVLPRRQKCPAKVAGGILSATAKDVKEPIKATLTYRLKYKTKDGERQTSHVYGVSLFP